MSNPIGLHIDANASAQAHVLNFKALEQVHVRAKVSSSHDIIVSLDIHGSNALLPTLAGGYIELISQCRLHGVEFVATAYTPLFDTLACIWIAADHRRILECCYLFITEPNTSFGIEEYSRSWPVEGGYGRTPATTCRASEDNAYKYCLSKIEEHVEVSDILGQSLGVEQLKSLLLIGDVPEALTRDASAPDSNDLYPF